MSKESQLNLILCHLFKKESQREAVKCVLEGMSAYQAERLHGLPTNYGIKLVKRFNEHTEYLKSLGLEVDF